MADTPAGLKETRDSLHHLAMHLLEMSARAQLAGSATMVVTTTSFISMAQDVFKAVIALEATLGGQGTPEPTAKPPAKNGFDPSEYLAKLTEQVKAQTEEIQRKSFEDLQRQYEERQKGNAPSVTNPVPPPAPVSG